jgi:diguanylate cyclase
MDYQDSVERSAEYLRLALPLMSKQTAALNPVSYAVWYDYVSGRNAELKTRIEELTREGRMLDDAATRDLFHRHIAAMDEELAQSISQGFQKVMADVSKSTAEAGSDAGQFGSALEKWTEDVARLPDAGAPGLAALLGQTRQMQHSIATLKNRLDESHSEIDRLRQEVVRARQESLADGLTGLTNRRGFDQVLMECLAGKDGAQPGPCLLITDIDHFKRINDSYGHLFGDKVLRTIAQVVKDSVKGRDTAARYGGEEFAVLLPDTPVDGARTLAEQIRTKVERCRIKRSGSEDAVDTITISIGVTAHRVGEPAHDFIARADSALYQAKNQGRNRVIVARVGAT